MNIKTCSDKALQLVKEYSQKGALISDAKNKDYILQRNNLIDAAQKEIATVAKRISKSMYISQNPITPLGGKFSNFEAVMHDGSDITYQGIAKAYYFEVDNTATVYVEELGGSAWNILSTINNAVKGKYTPYKGIINSNNTVRLRFSGNYLYNLKNVALFSQSFEKETDIPNYRPYVPFEMPDDFFLLKTINCEAPNRQYLTLGNYYWQGQKTLMLDYFNSNQVIINYYAYPTTIDDSTQDTQELELDAEAVELIPYYLAAYLKNDDELNLSVNFQNIYEAKLARLTSNDIYGSTVIQNTMGW